MSTRARGYAVVVDDERLIADTLVMILEKFGYVASAAYSGEDALVLCHAFKPDILISDVVMGRLSGLQLALEVRAYYPDCNIILISGDPATHDLVQKTASEGATFEVLAKPLQPLELLSRLDQVGVNPLEPVPHKSANLQAVFDKHNPRKSN